MAEFRRKSPRRPFKGLSGVLHHGKLVSCACLQIGEGGALIKGSQKNAHFKEGDDIVITIFFPRIGGIVTQAKCLYRGEDGSLGISFSDLKMDYKKIVREFVSRRKMLDL